MKNLIRLHQQLHPIMEAQDIVKLVFQAKLGCGHLLADESTIVQRIEAEMGALSPCIDEPLTEPLGNDYVRLNLRRAMAEGIASQWIARMMLLSAPEQLPSRNEVVSILHAMNDDAVSAVSKRLIDEPEWIPSHTKAYHAAYAPAYRVISTRCAVFLPILQRVAEMAHKDQLLICIDGRCGSGKTTLANMLRQVLDAPVVSMDDFFLPHEKKTADRLAQPGGNADWERLVEEFLHPWLENGTASYRKYNCHADAMGDQVTIPCSKVTIIEGSYSLLPAISHHADLNVFLDISPEEQQKRILQRNGARMLQMFNERWIPLEEAYFSAYGLPDESCLMLYQQSV